eukprot:scaffold250_cov110-Isochrysis_galbana.AAC.22
MSLHLGRELGRLQLGHLRPLRVPHPGVDKLAVPGHQGEGGRPPVVASVGRVEELLTHAAPMRHVGVDLEVGELGLREQLGGRVGRAEQPLPERRARGGAPEGELPRDASVTVDAGVVPFWRAPAAAGLGGLGARSHWRPVSDARVAGHACESRERLGCPAPSPP